MSAYFSHVCLLQSSAGLYACVLGCCSVVQSAAGDYTHHLSAGEMIMHWQQVHTYRGVQLWPYM